MWLDQGLGCVSGLGIGWDVVGSGIGWDVVGSGIGWDWVGYDLKSVVQGWS